MQSFESIDQITPLDALDVSARLEQLAQLSDNWLDGNRTALDKTGLDWLEKAFRQNYPSDLLLPNTYPTAEGDVRFEWHLADGTDASLEIDLKTQMGYWHELNLESNDNSEDLLRLEKPEAWATLSERLRSAMNHMHDRRN